MYRIEKTEPQNKERLSHKKQVPWQRNMVRMEVTKWQGPLFTGYAVEKPILFSIIKNKI